MRRPDHRSENRLDELRREGERGAVRARGIRPSGAPFPGVPFRGAPSGSEPGATSSVASPSTGYYGRPLLQQPTWTWEVPLYFFVGGAAGASAVVAASACLAGSDHALVRDARWVAALGAAVSAPLLISDLGRPERFLNMLRVWKPQSPMSVGAWTLTAFGGAASAAAFAELLDRRGIAPVRVIADAGGLLAAATGLSMATYTGVLVGATTIPAWNRNVRVLPAHFAASGLAAAVSLLELLGHRQRALNRLGIAAALVEIATGAHHELDDDPAHAPLKEGSTGALMRTAGMLSGPLPLLLRLLGKRKAAAATAIAGSLLTRYGWVEAGKVSARDPRVPLALDEPPSALEDWSPALPP